MPAAPEGGCKNMEVEATLPTNPKKGRADKHKLNMYSIRETCRPVIKNIGVHVPG